MQHKFVVIKYICFDYLNFRLVHPCDKDDHGCEQICEKIKDTNGSDDFKCACHQGHILGHDLKSCVKGYYLHLVL